MRERIATLFLGILLISFAFPGCAYMSKSGRQQMAYRHYLRKHIRERQHRIARAEAEAKRHQKRQLSSIEPSAPIVNANVEPVQPMTQPATISPSTISATNETQEEP